MRRRYLLILLCFLFGTPAYAGSVTVAVASNFADLATEIGAAFEARTPHRIRIAKGSSGRLFAQIVNGAPYDVFLSADVARPMALEEKGMVAVGSRRTYAIGQLVIWSRDPRVNKKNCRERLANPGRTKIAIANPELAPYGAAAKEFLQTEGLWARVESNLVIGENISQTLQFAASGGASLGIIALSQVRNLNNTTCLHPVPPASHSPVEQQLVLLKHASDNESAQAFLKFLQTNEVRSQIRERGYRVAGDPQ